MSNTPLLLKPSFWYAFVTGAVICMFVFGLRRTSDNSLLAQARRDIVARQSVIDAIKNEKVQMAALLVNREQELQKREHEISTLSAEVAELRSLVPPYGNEKGLLSIFNGCDCPALLISIDGSPAGSPVSQPDASRDCGIVGAVTIAGVAGTHQVSARDARGHNWDFQAVISANKCTRHTLVLQQ